MSPLGKAKLQVSPFGPLSVVGDSVAGDSIIGDSVVGDSVIGDSVVGDFVVGDSVVRFCCGRLWKRHTPRHTPRMIDALGGKGVQCAYDTVECI
jgi:hypothetical protein